MSDYTPRTVVSYFIVKSHCPAIIGRVLGFIGVPGFQAHTVVISSSDEEATVNVRNWSGAWYSIKLGPVEQTEAALDRLARSFM